MVKTVTVRLKLVSPDETVASDDDLILAVEEALTGAGNWAGRTHCLDVETSESEDGPEVWTIDECEVMTVE